jgi:cyclopropane-fatty-acyl-phospholipid synthase
MVQDQRFCRMWEFHLAAAEVFFRRQDGMVFQIQLARTRHAVPLTQDCITDAERALPTAGVMTNRAA